MRPSQWASSPHPYADGGASIVRTRVDGGEANDRHRPSHAPLARATILHRKSATKLSEAQLADLRRAFAQVIAFAPLDDRGYQYFAGWHGVPLGLCVHHEPLFCLSTARTSTTLNWRCTPPSNLLASKLPPKGMTVSETLDINQLGYDHAATTDHVAGTGG